MFQDFACDAPDATITQSSKREPSYWPPTLGSVEVFRTASAPLQF